MGSESHTPGPWFADGPDYFGDYNIVRHPDTGEALAVAAVVSNLRDRETVCQNARLIAAAPDMLEALKNLIAWRDTGFSPPGTWERARAIISQATVKTTEGGGE